MPAEETDSPFGPGEYDTPPDPVYEGPENPYYLPGGAGGPATPDDWRFWGSIIDVDVAGTVPVDEAAPSDGFTWGNQWDIPRGATVGPVNPYYGPGGAGGIASPNSPPSFWSKLWSGVKSAFSAIGNFLARLAKGAKVNMGGSGGGIGKSAKEKNRSPDGKLLGAQPVQNVPGTGLSPMTLALIAGGILLTIYIVRKA